MKKVKKMAFGGLFTNVGGFANTDFSKPEKTSGGSSYQPSQNLISRQQVQPRAAARADIGMQQMRQQQQASAQARAAAEARANAIRQAQLRERITQDRAVAEKKKQDAIHGAPTQPPRPPQFTPPPPVRDPKLIVDPNPPKPPLPVQPKPLAEFTRPTSTSPQPPVQSKNYGEFNDFGFDRPLLDYLNKQQEMSTYDAGISYQYDPATQTFTGGTRGYGPIKKTLQEMQAESQSKTPLASAQPYKKGGQVKAAQDTKKKYTSGGKINLNECRVSTTPKGKTNPNW